VGKVQIQARLQGARHPKERKTEILRYQFFTKKIGEGPLRHMWGGGKKVERGLEIVWAKLGNAEIKGVLPEKNASLGMKVTLA